MVKIKYEDCSNSQKLLAMDNYIRSMNQLPECFTDFTHLIEDLLPKILDGLITGTVVTTTVENFLDEHNIELPKELVIEE